MLPLLRLRYRGSAHHWGFGLYLASSQRYENQLLPTGFPIDTPEEAHNALALRRQLTLWSVT
ncbi:hypothetical protein [Amycolatopsis pigmentata]|uniref:Uncharacterized protein n=1 Tax=Amycolatopsis pigmentata TaxID=450801 RepID=A0ABW5FLL0_9PSEU